MALQLRAVHPMHRIRSATGQPRDSLSVTGRRGFSDSLSLSLSLSLPFPGNKAEVGTQEKQLYKLTHGKVECANEFSPPICSLTSQKASQEQGKLDSLFALTLSLGI